MKKFCIFFSVLLIASSMYGQIDDLSKIFEDFKKQNQQHFDTFSTSTQAKYDAFRKAQNEQYAEFITASWETMTALPPVMPIAEEPVEPVIYEATTENSLPATAAYANAIPTKDQVIVLPKPEVQPEPIAPVAAKASIPSKIVSISFYGTLISVGFPATDDLRIKTLNERALADAWMHLADAKYDITLENVLTLRKDLALCDWGYINMLQAITEKQYGKSNEAVLMQAFLLAQSNYKIRLAYGESKLYTLIASQYSILGMSRYEINDEYFYPLNCDVSQLKICKAFFENEKAISLQLRQEQRLAQDLSDTRKLISKYGVVANVAVNKNDIEFFNDYPSAYLGDNIMTRWVVYANTPLSSTIQEELYPTLKKAITGLSEKDAVNKLLNFVQTALTYGYDEQIWGTDRAFFAAETLHYPYSDCEDRSILFARLVRDLVGLDIVLVYYPGHLATAVNFNQDVYGDYLTYKGRRYTVCDPTYVNAPVGRTMPGMNNTDAQVIVIK